MIPGKQKPRIPSTYRHSGHLGCCPPCRAAVFQVLPAGGPCAGQAACRDPPPRLEICASVTRTVGTDPLSRHLRQLSCETQVPRAFVGEQDCRPRARAGESARLGRQGSLRGLQPWSKVCLCSLLVKKGCLARSRGCVGPTVSGWSIVSELRRLSVQIPSSRGTRGELFQPLSVSDPASGQCDSQH